MGFVTDWLQDILKDKQEKLNSINEDIAELEDALACAESASQLFEEAGSGMNGLRSDVQNVFKGNAAEAFTDKLLIYCIYCDSRKEHMDRTIDNIKWQLQIFDKQRNNSQKSIERLEGFINLLKSWQT